MQVLETILAGWGIVAVFFFLLWVHSVRKSNAGWVDVGWSFSLVLLVAWYAFRVDGVPWRRGFYAALAGFWGLRLAWHILVRLLQEKKEDPRYAYLREHWEESASRNFFFFFQAQGFANLLLTAPIFILMHVPKRDLSVFDVLGTFIIMGAVLGETIADQQLSRWRGNPANKGKTCRHGLWRYSRHPNYFFEWLHWLGYPVLGLVLWQVGMGSWWFPTLLAPAVMLVLLLQFTGIPYTEKQALKSRGEDYRKYQEEVSGFIPWFPNNKTKDGG